MKRYISLRQERNLRFREDVLYEDRYEKRLSRVSSSISKSLISPEITNEGNRSSRVRHEGERKAREKNTRSRQHSLREATTYSTTRLSRC